MLSRSKFREDTSGKAWQRLVREEKAREYDDRVKWWEGVDLSLKRSRVRPITRQQAEKMILEYEWLGTMAPTRYHYGIFFGEVLGGVGCVGTNAGGRNTHRMFGVKQNRCVVLARGACPHWTPKGTASRLIAWTDNLLAREDVADVMLAYGDPEAGEIGTVYQACNWHYIGTSGKQPDWALSPENKVLHTRGVSALAARNDTDFDTVMQALVDAGWQRMTQTPKHRYCTILAEGATKRRIEAKIAPLIEPYPKREN